jgi:hypothetical protein
MHNLTTAKLCVSNITILTKKLYHEQMKEKSNEHKGEWPKYYTNYAEDKAAPQGRCLEWGIKKRAALVAVPKRGSLTCQATTSADTGNKRGITSKKVRGVAMSKKGSSFSSSATTRVGKDKVGKEQHKLERHLGYDYSSSSED